MGQKASLYFPLEVSTVGNCSELTGLFSTQHPQQLLGPAPLSWGPELLQVLLGLAALRRLAQLIWSESGGLSSGRFPRQRLRREDTGGRWSPESSISLDCSWWARLRWRGQPPAPRPRRHRSCDVIPTCHEPRGHGDCYFDRLHCFQIFVICAQTYFGRLHPIIYKNVPRSHSKHTHTCLYVCH